MKVPRDALEVLAADEDVVAAYLFGSRAADLHRDDSDWDLALLWAESVAPAERFRRRTRLMESLAHLLGARVDVVDLRSTTVLLGVQAVRGNLLFDRDSALRATFEMRLYSREDDERIALRWIRQARPE